MNICTSKYLYSFKLARIGQGRFNLHTSRYLHSFKLVRKVLEDEWIYILVDIYIVLNIELYTTEILIYILVDICIVLNGTPST